MYNFIKIINQFSSASDGCSTTLFTKYLILYGLEGHLKKLNYFIEFTNTTTINQPIGYGSYTIGHSSPLFYNTRVFSLLLRLKNLRSNLIYL